MTDPIADFLTRIRNAGRAHKVEIEMPYSKMKQEIARVLKDEGYIADYSKDTSSKIPVLKVQCKFVKRVHAITNLKRVSRPGIRRYVGATEIPRVLGGMGIAILSTSRGILSGHEAKRQNIGGELLAYVW